MRKRPDTPLNRLMDTFEGCANALEAKLDIANSRKNSVTVRSITQARIGMSNAFEVLKAKGQEADFLPRFEGLQMRYEQSGIAYRQRSGLGADEGLRL